MPMLSGRKLFEALYERFVAAFWSADADTAMRCAERARELAAELGDDELRARSLWFDASAIAMVGRTGEAVELETQAFALWRPGALQAELSDALSWAGIHHYWRGEYEQGERRSREARNLGNEVHSVTGLLNGTAHECLTLTGLGRHEEALRLAEEGIARGRELDL
jgi:hypothetical protein